MTFLILYRYAKIKNKKKLLKNENKSISETKLAFKVA
jgi:hypothetical protein